MIVTSAFTLVFGQTPEAKKEKDAAPQAFAWSFDGEGAYLGVQTIEINKDNFAKYGLRDARGVGVEKVIENSPAAAAGIKDGDVIVRFNGEEITSARKLTRLVGEIDPDHQAKITISRNGSEQELTATLAKRPGPKFEGGNFEFRTPTPMDKFEMPDLKGLRSFKEMPAFKDLPELKNLPKDGTPFTFSIPGGEGKAFAFRTGNRRQIGVGITPLSKQLAEHFGVDGGVMVSEVRENSPAAKAGLKAGDIIVEANGNAVNDDGELIRLINDKKEGDITLTIVRDGKRQTKSVTPEAAMDGGLFTQGDGESGWRLSADPMVAPAPTQLVRPAKPAAPMVPPTPMTLFRGGRII